MTRWQAETSRKGIASAVKGQFLCAPHEADLSRPPNSEAYFGRKFRRLLGKPDWRSLKALSENSKVDEACACPLWVGSQMNSAQPRECRLRADLFSDIT